MRCNYRCKMRRCCKKPIKKKSYLSWEEIIALGDSSVPVLAELNKDALGYVNALEGHVVSMALPVEEAVVTIYVLMDSMEGVVIPPETEEDMQKIAENMHLWDERRNSIGMATTSNPEVTPPEGLLPEGVSWGERFTQSPGK